MASSSNPHDPSTPPSSDSSPPLPIDHKALALQDKLSDQSQSTSILDDLYNTSDRNIDINESSQPSIPALSNPPLSSQVPLTIALPIEHNPYQPEQVPIAALPGRVGDLLGMGHSCLPPAFLAELQRALEIPKEYILRVPNSVEHPEHTTLSTLSFCLKHLTAGLCFPIPPLLIDISNIYLILLN